MNDIKREKILNSIDPKKGIKKGVLLGILSIPLIWIGISLISNFFYYIVGISILPDYALLLCLFGLPILAIILFPIYFEEKNAQKREYLSLIDNHKVVSLDEISTSLSLPYDKVKNDVKNMINQGFWGNAHIDNVTRSIVLPLSGVNINTQVVKSTKECPNCRAMNEISSLKENKCEYCGTLLD